MSEPHSPRHDRRRALVEAALELLGESGPTALTTRKVAQRAGTTTMALYSAFGDIGSLVNAVVAEGFSDLDAAVAAAPSSGDPLAELWSVARAFVDWAVAHPQLYLVIYGVAPAGGYRRTGEELLQGSQVFARFMAILERAIAGGQLAERPAYDATLYLWTMGHGGVMVAVSGYLDSMPPPDRDFLAEYFTVAMVGLGAAESEVRSVTAG